MLSEIIENLWRNSAFRSQAEETIRYAYAEPFPGTIIGCRAMVVRERPLQIQRQLAGQAVNTWMVSSNWSRTNDNENSITFLGLEKADCRGNPGSRLSRAKSMNGGGGGGVREVKAANEASGRLTSAF